MELMKI